MKKLSGTLFLLSLLVISLISGCAKDEEKPISIPKFIYNLSGRVLDNDGEDVPDAKVTYVSGDQSAETTTDASGEYRFQNLYIGVYTIDVTKSGYTFGRTIAEVTENGAIVSNVILKNLTVIEERVERTVTSEEIKESGITIETEVEANVSLGEDAGTETVQQKVEASIPPETVITINDEVVEEITLAVAPLEIDEIPPPPEDEMPMGAAIFEPVDAKFDRPVEVKVPIEIRLPEGLEIPLKKFVDGEWKEVGTATIDETGLGADAEVTEFGQFALQPKVDITEVASEPVETEGKTTEIEKGQTVIEAEVTDTVEFPQGLPEGVTTEYAVSLIEKLKGINIGESKKLILEIPSVSKVAKPVSVLSADEAEVWVQICSYVIIDIETTESITLVIELGDTSYTFTIEFTYIQKTVETKCTQEWIEHGQGEI